jgi:hypothetical protein
MKKEDILVVSQLLSAIKSGLERLDDAQKKNDKEGMAMVKQEILGFQREINEIL